MPASRAPRSTPMAGHDARRTTEVVPARCSMKAGTSQNSDW
jgi:hypothetical protein